MGKHACALVLVGVGVAGGTGGEDARKARKHRDHREEATIWLTSSDTTIGTKVPAVRHLSEDLRHPATTITHAISWYPTTSGTWPRSIP